MNALALERLLTVREHRVGVARALLDSKRRVADACESEEQRLLKRLEDILLQRLQQQRAFGKKMQSNANVGLSLANAQQLEQFVGRLTDLATSAGEEIVAARKALAQALEDVAVARRALRHAMAKRDALVKVMDEYEHQARRQVARRQDEESEEIAARRVAVT